MGQARNEGSSPLGERGPRDVMQFIVDDESGCDAASRLPVGQPLEPRREARSLCPLGLGLVRLPLGGRNPDVYTHAGGVFDGWSTPRSFGLGHWVIMSSQKRIDKPLPILFNVLTLNQEATMKEWNTKAERIQQAIDECDRFIAKEEPRRADLRPAGVQQHLDFCKEHKVKLQKMLEAE